MLKDVDGEQFIKMAIESPESFMSGAEFMELAKRSPEFVVEGNRVYDRKTNFLIYEHME